MRGRVILFSCFLTIPSSLIFIRVQQYLKPGEGPIVLVLAPTRELAVQIKEECDKFGSSSDIKNTVVYGGVPKSRQIRDLRSGVEIVIATPGRLIDHLEQGNTNLKRVTYLVLDEAGKMFCLSGATSFLILPGNNFNLNTPAPLVPSSFQQIACWIWDLSLNFERFAPRFGQIDRCLCGRQHGLVMFRTSLVIIFVITTRSLSVHLTSQVTRT